MPTVVRDGQTTCVRPGTGAGECGTGINFGEGISFNIDYLHDKDAASGEVSFHDEMKDLAAQAKRVGINLSLTTHTFSKVISTAAPCTPKQSACKWTAQNWGLPFYYGTDFLPTGEPLYAPGGFADAGSYTNPKMDRLIQATVTGPAASETTALTEYDNYAAQQLPVVFAPTQIGTYRADAGTLIANNLGGYAANAFDLMNPEDWYFTR